MYARPRRPHQLLFRYVTFNLNKSGLGPCVSKMGDVMNRFTLMTVMFARNELLLRETLQWEQPRFTSWSIAVSHPGGERNVPGLLSVWSPWNWAICWPSSSQFGKTRSWHNLGYRYCRFRGHGGHGGWGGTAWHPHNEPLQTFAENISTQRTPSYKLPFHARHRPPSPALHGP